MSNQREEVLKLRHDFLKSLVHDSPSAKDGLTVRSFGDAASETVRFFLYQDVLEELAFASHYRDECCYAVLRGHFAMDDEGAFIEVSGFDGLEYISDIGEMFDDVREAVEHSMRDISRGEVAGGRHVVGLFVGNPGSDAKLDAEIARVHLSLFNMPFQIAMVIDPKSQQIGIYTRAPRSKFHGAAFYVVKIDETAEDTAFEAARIEESEVEPAFEDSSEVEPVIDGLSEDEPAVEDLDEVEPAVDGLMA